MPRKYNFKTYNRSRKRYGVRFNNKKGHELLIILGFVLFVSLSDYFWYIATAGFLILSFYLYDVGPRSKRLENQELKKLTLWMILIITNGFGFNPQNPPALKLGSGLIFC